MFEFFKPRTKSELEEIIRKNDFIETMKVKGRNYNTPQNSGNDKGRKED